MLTVLYGQEHWHIIKDEKAALSRVPSDDALGPAYIAAIGVDASHDGVRRSSARTTIRARPATAPRLAPG